ncbi:MAG: penicillin-binding protein 2 [Rikenellaceae bacterium]
MSRYNILRIFVVLIFLVIIIRLFQIQVLDDSYKNSANRNVLRYETVNPPRGEIYDRNGVYLAQSAEAYDLIAIPREIEAFDTLLLANLIGVSKDKLKDEIRKAKRYSPRSHSVIFKQLPKEVKIRLDERPLKGFYTTFRTIRYYPQKIGGNLLGYVGEVNQRIIDNNPYYKMGDYIGLSGIEQAYEKELRGVIGTKINLVDVHGVLQGSYNDGEQDTQSVSGKALTCTIDSRLQLLAEQLLEGKVGSVVAIEPATGEILVMASSPTYNPDELIGRERGNNYMKLLNNPRHPLFNRSVSSLYPPGSTFKMANALIGLQEGVLKASYNYPCNYGYHIGRGVKCHEHSSPINLHDAISTSCNAYFCYVYRNIVDNKKYMSVKDGFDVWYDYVMDFGFGRKLNSDFTNELNGYVPTREFYDKRYRGSWNSLTNISLAIGQGELGCTPLQMANFAATIANRGHYFIPHVVKKVEGVDSLDNRFYERHQTKIDTKYYDDMVEGMYRAVHKKQGTASVAYLKGFDVCGKTGTAENSHGADHSTFISFAPRVNPSIAISVYIENGRFGATVAAPIATLITELYLTGEIKREALLEYVKKMEIKYPYYEK